MIVLIALPWLIYFAFVGGQIYSNCYYLNGWT
jgi:hypothetical protein